MKVAGVIILVLALVVGILPQFTDCQSQGRAMTLSNGLTTPMKCHWTAIAEGALAVPILLLGGMLFFSKRKETRLSLAALGVVLGVVSILAPTVLIGVCANSDMLCNMVMKPALILSGLLIGAISLGSGVFSFTRMEQPAA